MSTIIRTNSRCGVGNRWGIASVNKSVSTDSNKVYNFKFIINESDKVTYDGAFEFGLTQYQDRYSSALSGVEQNSYVRLPDMKRIVRDYPEITTSQIISIILRLTNTCLECVKHGMNSLEKYILCVRLDGTYPPYLTMPHLPFDIYTPSYPGPTPGPAVPQKAFVMEDTSSGEVMIVDATPRNPVPPQPGPQPGPEPGPEPGPTPPSSVIPDSGIIMQDLDTGEVMSKN